jgi:hypothetical protein
MRFIFIISRALTRARPGYTRLGVPDEETVSNRANSLVMCKRLVKSVLFLGQSRKIVLCGCCIAAAYALHALRLQVQKLRIWWRSPDSISSGLRHGNPQVL